MQTDGMEKESKFLEILIVEGLLALLSLVVFGIGKIL